MDAASAIPVKLNSNGPREISTQSTTSVLGGQQLDQDDFLELLVSQMKNQDPLNPDADLDSFTQMAQFTNIEQNKELGATLQRIEANSLIGKNVDLELGGGDIVQGTVESIRVSAGTPKLIVGGVQFDLNQVVNVLPVTEVADQPDSSAGDQASLKK